MRIPRSVLILMILASVTGGLCAAAPPRDRALPAVTTLDTTSVVDVNQIRMLVTNAGSFAHSFRGLGDAGMFFPSETNQSPVYAAGLWVGARVGGQTRVALAEYSVEYQPGKIAGGGWDDPEDPRFHVYKIAAGDTLSSDYLNWPVADGAPVDSLGRPPFLGDQTLWSVYNDADPAKHTNFSGSTAPLGIEVQQTTWAFHRPDISDNLIRLRFKILNKGPNTLDSTHITCWVDPDIGGRRDDLVGCDTTLALGFSYNATDADSIYGSNPPAVGFWLEQGPIVASLGDTALVDGRRVPGYRNLGVYSFNQYMNSADPGDAAETFHYMDGLTREGQPLVDPTTGYLTTFAYTGDPVAGTGWLDPNPGDQRMMLTTGPITIAPGDSQIVTFALAAAQGTDRLDSITLLKHYVRETDFPTPVILAGLSAERRGGSIVVQWDVSRDVTGATFTVYREIPGGERERVSDAPLSGGPTFAFVDHDPPSGEVFYWLRAGAPDGSAEWLGPVRVAAGSPAGARLALAIDGRNPFRANCTLSYVLPRAGDVRLTIHDLRGAVVRTLVGAVESEGAHVATWDGRDDAGRAMPAGIYLARIESQRETRTAKLLRMR